MPFWVGFLGFRDFAIDFFLFSCGFGVPFSFVFVFVSALGLALVMSCTLRGQACAASQA
jgi:hypothetical protein